MTFKTKYKGPHKKTVAKILHATYSWGPVFHIAGTGTVYIYFSSHSHIGKIRVSDHDPIHYDNFKDYRCRWGLRVDRCGEYLNHTRIQGAIHTEYGKDCWDQLLKELYKRA